MKILAFTDVHGHMPSLLKIALTSANERPDVLVCCGDITVFEHDIDKMISIVDKIGITTLIVHGNHEAPGRLDDYCKRTKNIKFLHARSYKIGKHLFIGYGGGGFNSSDLGLESFISQFANHREKKIFVTHAPPHGTKLDDVGGYPAGNKSLRNMIIKLRPDLVLSGHLHENLGVEDKIGNTRIINPGESGKIIII